MNIILVKDFAAADGAIVEGGRPGFPPLQAGDLLVAQIDHDITIEEIAPGWTDAGTMIDGKRIVYKTHTDPTGVPEYDVMVFRNVHKMKITEDDLLLHVMKPWNAELRRNHPEVPGFDPPKKGE